MKNSCICCLMVIIIFIVALSVSSLHLGVVAGNSAVVWSDKKDYFPDETARIFGYGFKPISQVEVTIIRPDLNTDVLITSTDEFGYFECQYALDGIHGIFNVTATDGTNTATTTFENCLHLRARWSSCCCWYIWAKASALRKSRSYYVKYFDPNGVERKQSPTYSGVRCFRDNFTITPSLPNILGRWTVKLYEDGIERRVDYVYVSRMVWTTDSTYSNLVTSFYQGETIYFKAIGLKSNRYYRFMLETPSHNRIYIGDWTTGVETLTGNYTLPADAETGSWKLHVKEALDASGSLAHHYVDTCRFKVTCAPPPPKYYLTVKTDPEGIVTIPGEGWYEVSTYVNLTAPELVAGPSDGIRYRFDYWDVDGVSQGAGVDEISVYMDGNHTATAHYVVQYYLNMTSNPPEVTVPAGEGWYDAGTNVSIYAPEYVGITPGASRYRFDGWTTADMSEIADPSSVSTTVYLDKPKTVTANYVKQYNVTFEQMGIGADYTGTIVVVDGNNYDSLPVSFWWDEGSTHSFAFQSPLIASDLKRYVWESTTGLSNKQSDTITVTTNGTITGIYLAQYKLTVRTSGLGTYITNVYDGTNVLGTATDASPYTGWFNEGKVIQLNIDSPITNSSERKVFSGWSGDASGTARPLTLTMDSAKDITANYKTQFLIVFEQTGLDDTAVGTVVTINSVNYTFADLPLNVWADEGSVFTYSYKDVIPSSGAGKRFKLIDISGPASPFTVTGAVTVTANYKTQYQVTFSQTGLDSSATGTVVTVNGVPIDYSSLPFSKWMDYGATVTYNYEAIVSSSVSGKRFALSSLTGPTSPFTVNGATTITGNYIIQYYLTVKTDPPGIATIPGEGWYNESSQVDLTAPTVPNYQFDYWDVDGVSQGVGVASITVNMTAPHTATAHYVPQQYTLTIITTTGGTTNPPPGSYTYDAGTVVSVTAVPEQNYQFDYWELDGLFYSNQTTVEVVMDSDHELKAFFKYVPPLSVSISPQSVTLRLKESVTFTASASGGVPPYEYQWYLNDEPVPGATSQSWTFTPTTVGTYYVYVVVTDSTHKSVQSPAAKVVVTEKVPTVGGPIYPITFTPKAKEHLMLPAALTLALIGIMLCIFIRKRKFKK